MNNAEFNAIYKVFRCFDTSETLEQLETSRKVMENYIKLHDCSKYVLSHVRTKYELKIEELTRDVK